MCRRCFTVDRLSAEVFAVVVCVVRALQMKSAVRVVARRPGAAALGGLLQSRAEYIAVVDPEFAGEIVAP